MRHGGLGRRSGGPRDSLHPPSPAALAGLLAAIGLLNSVGSDLVIPSLPALRADLRVTNWHAQQVIALFFAACAFMSLWYGALADAWGRRTVTLGALGIVLLATVGCALSRQIEQLWGLRVLQGVASGAGLVISRTIVGDLHTGVAAQRLLSRILIVQTFCFALMPALGGWLTDRWGWRSVFAVSTVLIASLALACWRWLPETLPPARRRPLRFGALWRAYGEVVGSRSFLRFSIAHVANWGVMAMYAFAAPAIVIGLLGRGAGEVFLVFLAMTGGLIAGFLLFPRLVRARQGEEILALAYGIIGVSCAINLAVCSFVPPGLWHLLPIVGLTVGMALALPILIDWALSAVHEHAGVAASCQTFLQFTVMALCAGLLVPLLWGSLFMLALGATALIAIGALCLWLELRKRRQLAIASA